MHSGFCVLYNAVFVIIEVQTKIFHNKRKGGADMAHEILSVKLCQLDDRIGKLHSRIHMSEIAGHSQLRKEIEVMEQE